MHRMTQIEFLTLKQIIHGKRVMDIDGHDYETLQIIVSSFTTHDLLWLAGQRINFVSDIAGRIVARRSTIAPIVSVEIA